MVPKGIGVVRYWIVSATGTERDFTGAHLVQSSLTKRSRETRSA